MTRECYEESFGLFELLLVPRPKQEEVFYSDSIFHIRISFADDGTPLVKCLSTLMADFKTNVSKHQKQDPNSIPETLGLAIEPWCYSPEKNASVQRGQQVQKQEQNIKSQLVKGKTLPDVLKFSTKVSSNLVCLQRHTTPVGTVVYKPIAVMDAANDESSVPAKITTLQ